MEKEYKEIEFHCGWRLEYCVLELIKHAVNGKFVCGKFNGHMLYSDTVSMDSANLEACGDTYFNRIRNDELRRKEIIEKKKKHKEEIPELTKYWIKKGHEILSKDKWTKWDECVPIRLNDLYEGMELGSCLDIIKTINEKSFEDAIEVMRNQGHSGFSWVMTINKIYT